ncbi:MAG: cytidylyltransferase domain-containing protein [Acidimicrobiaceae bacterium]
MIVAGIFARGGSKGVPNKNLRIVAGKSLLQRAVEHALSIKNVTDVYCSTDSSQIADEALKYGALVPWLRPSELAQDTSKEWDSWCHLVKWLNTKDIYPSYLVTVPTVSPLRSLEDLNACVDLALSSKADVVMAVSEANRNPWFNIVTINQETKQVRLVNEPKTKIYNRQAAPVVYDVSTVTFVIKCEFLLKSTSIYDGETRALVLPRSHCIDIDTEDDIEYADYLLKKRESLQS